MDKGNRLRLEDMGAPSKDITNLGVVIGRSRIPDMNYLSGADVIEAYNLLERATRILAGLIDKELYSMEGEASCITSPI
jgi:hypothetical protein